MLWININSAETFGPEPYLTKPKDVPLRMNPKYEPCKSLIVGTSFASQPRRRNPLSSIPQLRLFEDGDALGDLKSEFLE